MEISLPTKITFKEIFPLAKTSSSLRSYFQTHINFIFYQLLRATTVNAIIVFEKCGELCATTHHAPAFHPKASFEMENFKLFPLSLSQKFSRFLKLSTRPSLFPSGEEFFFCQNACFICELYFERQSEKFIFPSS